ncbi:ArnT family glycosyltransferase [Verrucomicrobiota bacterium]
MKKINTVLPLILFAVILAFAAYPRFVNLTNQGMEGCDTFQYWILGQKWAEGNFTLNDGFGGPCFRPVAFALHAIAMRLFGFNDYAIKILHASMDMLSIGLVFAIGALIARNLWVGVSSGVMYAFLPKIISSSREELLHTPSTTFLLLCILFYVVFDTVYKRRRLAGCLFLVLSGVCLSCTALVHPELAILGPAFVFIIFLSVFSTDKKLITFGQFVLYAFVFTLSYSSLYLVSIWVMGFEKVKYLTVGIAGEISKGETIPLELTVTFLTRGIAELTSKTMECLFLGTLPLMIILRTKGQERTVTAYLPWICWVGYGLLFEVLIGSELGKLFRVLIPLLPLVGIGIACWYTRALEAVLWNKWMANIVVLLGCVLLAWHNFSPYRRTLARDRAGVQTRFRAVYDVLKDRIDGKSKLLVTPYLEYAYRRAFQQGMYFGNKAVYIIDCPPSVSLDDVVREDKIKYIYVGKQGLDRRFLKKKRFHQHDIDDPVKWRGAELVLGGCYGMNNQTYSLEKEYAFLAEFIGSKGAKTLWSTADGTLYELP